MKAHELAKILLAGENLPVVINDFGYSNSGNGTHEVKVATVEVLNVNTNFDGELSDEDYVNTCVETKAITLA